MMYIALLRGINVGGNRPVKMSDLKSICVSLKFSRISTYLQSGNVVFDATAGDPGALAAKLEKALLQRCGFEVRVLVKSAKEWSHIIRKNPLLRSPGIELERLHVTFLLDDTAGSEKPPPPQGDLEIQKLKAKEEMIVQKGKEIYLYCPKGYGKSKLTNPNLERKLHAVATTRNWNTVRALGELASNR